MRVAIIHYWLIGMRGGERVLEALCRMYPGADIFTHVYDQKAVSSLINRHQVKTSFIGKLPFANTRYKTYLPLMPIALEQLDLRGYDLILSSEAGPAKGIIPPAGALHICYCHSPMRYIWNMFHDYRERSGLLTRMLMPPFSHYLRSWDAISATRVHAFAANSRTVARRLHTYYRRESRVIYPPVRVEDFTPVHAAHLEDFYLLAGELVPYKRPELAVEAFNQTRKKLVVVGGGEMLGRIRGLAGPTVEVLGHQSFDHLRSLYARCKALIFPGEEDFGMVPVEAMASGRPVIAFNKGGATETVVDGQTGCLFEEQTVACLIEALERFETMRFDVDVLLAQANKFNTHNFEQGMQALVKDSLIERGA